MTVSRPALLTVGTQVRFAGGTHTVAGLLGGTVALTDVAGCMVTVGVGRLLNDPSFEMAASTPPAPLPPTGLLD